MRIDAHVHYTPPVVLNALSDREPFWRLLLGPSPVPGPDPDRLIADMDAAGLDRVVLMGNYWRTHEMCVASNTALLELRRRWPDRIVAFASLQPAAGQAALDELQRCQEGGMLGVGELGPYGQGFNLDDPEFHALVEACVGRGLPLNLHVSEPLGHYYPGKSSTPLHEYYALARNYPDLKLIFAHWGGGLPFYEMMPEVRRALQNTYYDTAASPLLYPTQVIFPAVLAWLDPSKILYGSDYPIPVCRKKQAGPDFRPFIEEIAMLGLAPGIHDAIMGDNAARLLGVGDHTDVAAVVQAATGSIKGKAGSISPPAPDLRLPAAVIAANWPETRIVFDRYRIPWEDRSAPFWEPIEQAAAALGLGRDEQARLLADLNTCLASPSPANEDK